MTEKNIKIEKILFSKSEINDIVSRVALEIERDIKASGIEALTVICVLKGAFVFTADLIRQLDVKDINLEFISASSYGSGTVSSGEVIFNSLDCLDISGKNILIVEDIVDTGRTLKKLTEYIKSRNAASVKVCTMLDKPSRRLVEFEPDYTGAVISDVFIVGYGLDYAEEYRALPYIAALG